MNGLRKALAAALAVMVVVSFAPATALAVIDSAEANFSENAASAEVTVSSDADSNSALQAYLSQQLAVGKRPGPRRIQRRQQRDILTDNEKVVYDQILSQVESLLAGNRTSTAFALDFTAFPSANGKTEYTSEELGVTIYDPSTKKWADSKAVFAALEKIYEYDPSKVYEALEADHPSYFFWNGNSYSYASCPSRYQSSYSNGVAKITIVNKGSFTFKVSKPYSAANAEGTTEVDSSKIQTINAAVANAKAIVQEAAGKTDYEKLKYYVEKIASLNTYNHDAADSGMTSSQDSNPWAIIYVFDGNADTNVVCEGYAKAFKFLADNSQFSSDISVYTVSGNVSTPGSNGGPHMWNIVSIDGVSYHTDPTWCDADDGDIINWGEFLAGVTATSGGYNCTYPNYPEGASRYYVGNTAQYVFDNDTKTIYTSGELNCSPTSYVPLVAVSGITLSENALSLFGGASQTLTAAISPANATDKTITWSSSDPSVATVDETGKVTGVSTGTTTITATSNADSSKSATCTVTVTVSVTGLTLSSTSITVPLDGEVQLTAEVTPSNASDPSVTWSSSDNTVATVVNGKIKGLKADSTATITVTSNADSTIKATCQVKVGSYTFGDWTDNHDDKTHTRTANGHSDVTETAEHTWNDGTIETPATCGTAGTMKYTCTVCGATKTETIPATSNHTWDSGEATIPATCKDPGVKTYTCSTCHQTKTETIPKTNVHSFGEWTVKTAPTCTTTGQNIRKCSVCGLEQLQTKSALGHTYGAWEDSRDGETHKRTCSRDPRHVETENHSWDAGTVETPATCGSAGSTKYTCTVCHAEKTVEIHATGNHTWDAGTVTTPATCQADGVMTYTCTVCGQTKTEVIPKASAHSWGEWSTTKEPTCTEPGEESHKCSLCSTVETRPIAALAHSYGKWTDTGDGKTHIRKCSRNENHTETANHEFGAWTVTKQATTKETGLREHSCTKCGAVVTETIPVTTSGGSAGGSDSSGGSGSTGGTGTTGGSSSGSSTGGSGSSSTTGIVVPVAGTSTASITAPANASPQENAAAAAITAATTPSASTENAPTSLVTGSGWQESVSEAARAAEENADVRSFISDHAGETVTVTAVPRIEIAVVSAATASITYEITPKYDIVVTAGSASRTVALNAEVPVTTVVTVNIPVPESFASDGTVIYVIHKLDNGNVRYYRGTVKNGVLSFLNPDGFSEFTLSTLMPAGFVDSSLKTVYRLFNRNNGEHLFTTDEVEKTNCIKNGWALEGEACRVAAVSDTPVYRLINPSIGMHMYTTGTDEMEALKKCGWLYEGVAFYSAGAVPVYRVFDKNSNNCNHLFTTGLGERDALKSGGWNDEGIGWYAYE